MTLRCGKRCVPRRGFFARPPHGPLTILRYRTSFGALSARCPTFFWAPFKSGKAAQTPQIPRKTSPLRSALVVAASAPPLGRTSPPSSPPPPPAVIWSSSFCSHVLPISVFSVFPDARFFFPVGQNLTFLLSPPTPAPIRLKTFSQHGSLRTYSPTVPPPLMSFFWCHFFYFFPVWLLPSNRGHPPPVPLVTSRVPTPCSLLGTPFFHSRFFDRPPFAHGLTDWSPFKTLNHQTPRGSYYFPPRGSRTPLGAPLPSPPFCTGPFSKVFLVFFFFALKKSPSQKRRFLVVFFPPSPGRAGGPRASGDLLLSGWGG